MDPSKHFWKATGKILYLNNELPEIPVHNMAAHMREIITVVYKFQAHS
jgi:hypothetical protein